MREQPLADSAAPRAHRRGRAAPAGHARPRPRGRRPPGRPTPTIRPTPATSPASAVDEADQQPGQPAAPQPRPSISRSRRRMPIAATPRAGTARRRGCRAAGRRSRARRWSGSPGSPSGRAPAGAGCRAPPPRWPDRDARSARRAAAAARSSGRRARSPRAAPGRRTGHSRPRRPACRARPAGRGEIGHAGRRARRLDLRRRWPPGRPNRMLSRMLPANSIGRWPIQAVSRDKAWGTRSLMSAPLISTRPLSGRDEAQQDLDHRGSCPRPMVPPARASRRRRTRKLSPSSAGPRAGVPGQAHVLERHAHAARRDGADRQCGRRRRQRRQLRPAPRPAAVACSRS